MTKFTASADAPLWKRNNCSAITVTIASGRPDLFATLQTTLECDQDFRITCDRIRNPARLLSYLARQQPNLLLLEKRLLDRLGARSTRTIHAEFPDLRVLLLCDRVRSGLVDVIVRNCFHGFLLTSCPPDTYVKAIRTVSQGELWLPRALLEKAIFDPSHSADHDDPTIVAEPSLTRPKPVWPVTPITWTLPARLACLKMPGSNLTRRHGRMSCCVPA